MSADPIAILRDELERHPVAQRPLQHATAQFHLGGVLLERGALEDAEAAFTAAATLFAARGARTEQAKALNGLGSTLRAGGRFHLALRAFEHSAAAFARASLPLEEGAAHFNAGLVLRELRQPADAIRQLERAEALLDPMRVPQQAAAAATELGAVRLELGDVDAARIAHEHAVALADRAADRPTLAAAANALGLSELAAGRPAAAAEAFARAAAASPRSVRPEAFAMAKANLALAREREGERAAARLATRQALATPSTPEPVRAQAIEVLERVGTSPEDLRVVLEATPPVERAALVREELARGAEPEEWLTAIRSTTLDPAEIAELWLEGLLELPPNTFEEHVGAALAAMTWLDYHDRAGIRDAVTRAMARFHMPQWLRLQDAFGRAAERAGDPGPWR